MTRPLEDWPLAQRRAVAIWLLVICGLVFAMVVVGGYTRLTNAGLSIVDWKPIVGAIPPLTDAAWADEFAKYQGSPEYQQVNTHFTLEQFKPIFWTEWFHRFLGRLIGIAFAIPLIVFAARRWLPRRLLPWLVAIFVLGGLQGALGWYMVKSGLVHRPEVSQYRLTAHLSAAVLILGVTTWTALTLLAPRPPRFDSPARTSVARWARLALCIVCVMIVSGGFVAGTDAGFRWNTFPTMDGALVPSELYPSPALMAPFEDERTIQWNHRVLALVVTVVLVSFWWRASRASVPVAVRAAAHFVLGALALQAALGIATLVLGVPVALGVLHQAGAIVLFTACLLAVHRLRSDG
ncbi:MAG: COX15/CtaA family protein [Planctomycetes bacterium]|nr:COX15/CtaA family protein [Planctomycetota bacterium]MCC7169297.1 COX15/CtaA family protein [Planctomycetota bacterium]